jgi:hypothetical protein
MRDLKSLEERGNNLVESLSIDTEALKHQYYLMAEMRYRTHGCYREDGSLMDDEDYLKWFAKNFMTLDAWIELQTERRLHLFGRSDNQSTPEGTGRRRSGGHSDLSGR